MAFKKGNKHGRKNRPYFGKEKMWEVCEYKPKWGAGTFKSEDLIKRINELLVEIAERAKGDRQGGRFKIANTQDELIEAVSEHLRLSENTKNANLQTIKLLEERL